MLKILLYGYLTFLQSVLASRYNHMCTPSKTTTSGTYAPTGTMCSGTLIFEDDFKKFDLKKWSHEETLGGGGNWEFQWYTNNRSNSYVKDGILYIKPTLLSDEMGEDFLWKGSLDISSVCTDSRWYGCSRTGTGTHYLNPVKSARIHTLKSFSFKYGKVEIRAKLPRGDWLWPAIWFLPTRNKYSEWPASGEIDLVESRGNRNYINSSGVNIGSHLVSSTLHWGPTRNIDGYILTHAESLNSRGYDTDFHNYQMLWSEDEISFSIDNKFIGKFSPPIGGFWEWGHLDASGYKNPWKGQSKMAPFDQEFYIILNLACGGVAYFPDDVTNESGKPWENDSGTASRDFWKGKNQWLPTWALDTDNAAFKIDYIKIWAL